MIAAAGMITGVLVARQGFEHELHDALPTATWLAEPRFSTGLYPHLIAQQFSAPTAEMAAAVLGEHWVLVGSTRDGLITAFRGGSRTLFLEHGTPAVLELVADDPCSALAAPLPMPPPSDWLQFGTSPLIALDRVGHPITDISLAPCPRSGYWVRSPSSLGVVFRSTESGSYLLIGPLPAERLSGTEVPLAPGLGSGRLERSPYGPILEWQRGLEFSYFTSTVVDAQRTACMTIWPAPVCAFLHRE